MAGCSHPATAPHHDCREVHITSRDAKAYSQRQNKCAHGSPLSPDSHPRWYVSKYRCWTIAMLLMPIRKGCKPFKHSQGTYLPYDILT
jgi:hypothetical protein